MIKHRMVDLKAVSPRQRISPVTVVLGLTGSIGEGCEVWDIKTQSRVRD